MLWQNSYILAAGALNLLRNVETIDWTALYSGEICMDEVHRVRRVARRDIISLPTFVADVDKYRKQLRQIAIINGLGLSCASPPAKCTAVKNVELALPMPPVRRRQRITAKLTVTPAPARHSIKRASASIPTVNAEIADTDKVERAKDKLRPRLRLRRSAADVAAFRPMSNTSKELITLKKRYERSNGVDSMRLAIKRLNFVRPQ